MFRLGLMIDRRKNPREFFVSGWDPYVIKLTTASRDARNTKSHDVNPPVDKTVKTRWRTMLLKHVRLS